jgi:O-antigen/teichoic acid export membrane protein
VDHDGGITFAMLMNWIIQLRLPPEVIFRSDHLSRDLARKSVRGGMTTLTSQAIQFFLSVLSTMILARLLTPDDYGLVGMVMAITGFAAMFKNAGLSMATIQSEQITPAQISNLFWINAGISLALGIGLMAFAPWIARFYGRAELVGITIALSLTFVISGLTIQHQALLYRHMRFGALANIVIIPQVIGLGISIVLAWWGWRYWALVSASLVNTTASTLLTLYFCPWLPQWFQRGSGTVRMLTFGGHLTVTNIANYLASNMDNVLIGKFIGADGLGLYSRAYQLFMMPITYIRAPIANTILPGLCSLRNQPDRFANYYLKAVSILGTVTIPLSLYCVVEADFLIRTFLGERWLDAVPVFRMLAIAAVIHPLNGMQPLLLMSMGHSAKTMWWGIYNAVICICAFGLGIPFGIQGVAVCFAIAVYVLGITSGFYCFRETPVTISQFYAMLVPPFLTSVLAVLGLIGTKSLWLSDSAEGHLAGLAVFCGIYIAVSLSRKSTRLIVSMFLQEILSGYRQGGIYDAR